MLPLAPQNLAELRLRAAPAPIDVRGVEKGYTRVKRPMNDRAGRREVQPSPEIVTP
jgi:hypothetical protein